VGEGGKKWGGKVTAFGGFALSQLREANSGCISGAEAAQGSPQKKKGRKKIARKEKGRKQITKKYCETVSQMLGREKSSFSFCSNGQKDHKYREGKKGHFQQRTTGSRTVVLGGEDTKRNAAGLKPGGEITQFTAHERAERKGKWQAKTQREKEKKNVVSEQRPGPTEGRKREK